MKKKITNEEIGQLIGKIAEKLRSELDYDFRVAHSQMCIAEKNLVDSLNEGQQALYNNFVEKRNVFYKIAEDLYERKF